MNPKILSARLSVIFISTAFSMLADASGAQPEHIYDVVHSQDGQLISYRANQLEMKNISLIDFNNPIRNQGAIGSCQSFAFLGMVENGLFHKAGVSVDLSERFQLLANYLEFGALGDKPDQIRNFPAMISKYGTLPESAYPYSQLDKNSHVFQVDSAQGISSTTTPEIDLAIKDVAAEFRLKVLQEDRFFGPFPDGKGEVELPVRANFISSQIPLRTVYNLKTGENASCFSLSPFSNGMKVSPADFAKLCLEFQAEDYIPKVFTDPLSHLKSVAELCQNQESKKRYGQIMFQSARKALLQTLRSMINRESALIGFSVPNTIEGRTSVLWRERNTGTEAGHATLALGFWTADDLKLPANHKEGILASSLFDQLAKTLDPSYIPAPDSAPLKVKMTKRLNSKLGRATLEEQGILIFRNSWGEVAGQGGYQVMTFDYFLKNGMLTIARKLPAEQTPLNIRIQLPRRFNNELPGLIKNVCGS